MRTYTALYDNRADAEAAQAHLEQLGIIDVDDRRVADNSSSDLWRGGRGATPPEPDRRLYEEGVKRGGALLTVNVDDQNADAVGRYLDSTPAMDVESREAEYRQSGGYEAAAPAAAAAPLATARTDRDMEGEERIPIVEEQLRVGKRQVEGGSVRVRAYVVEQPVSEQVTLHQEHVDVERHGVDQPLSAADGDAFRERAFEVTERGEEAVVAKESRIIEEVVVHKDETDRVQDIDDTVRRTEVDVDRIEADRNRRL